MLASLVCKVENMAKDPSWLRELFPHLLKFFRCWLAFSHNTDMAEIPVWKLPMQTGLEDSPMYGLLYTESQGAAIESLFSPALGSMLVKECCCLIAIAERLEETSTASELRQQYDQLREVIDQCWDPEKKMYLYRDAGTGAREKYEQLALLQGSGEYSIQQVFEQPTRLQLRVEAAVDQTRVAKVTIFGETSQGELSETLMPLDIRWVKQIGRATTKALFKRVDRVEILGIGSEYTTQLAVVDYSLEDLSLFLPLWAEVPSPEKATSIIEESLIGRYLDKNGLVLTPIGFKADEYPIPQCISLPWSQIIIEGLLAYHYRSAAADILSRSLDAVSQCLKKKGVFYTYYHRSKAKGYGDKNSLQGLFPVRLLLQVLGVRFVSHREVIIDGQNPFPHVIKAQYKGVLVERNTDDTVVQFPGGHRIVVTGPGPHRVCLD
jgi:hypothetical protein